MYKAPKLQYTILPRKQITTTINKALHKKFQTLSVEIDEPTSKMFDVLLEELFERDNLHDFIYKVKTYGKELEKAE